MASLVRLLPSFFERKDVIGGGRADAHFVDTSTIQEMMSQMKIHAQWEHAKEIEQFRWHGYGQSLHVRVFTEDREIPVEFQQQFFQNATNLKKS